MINNNVIIVFDLETGGLGEDTEILEIGAIALDPRTLQEKQGGIFESLCKPDDFSKVTKAALDVNKKTIEQLEKAPDQKAVVKQFVEWINQYNPKPGNGFEAPIAAGFNITGFDLPILNYRIKKYKINSVIDKNNEPCLFNKRIILDLMYMLWPWFESDSELPNYKLDTYRNYFGMSGDSIEKAHSALQDVKDEARLLTKMVDLHRRLSKKVTFKGALAKDIF